MQPLNIVYWLADHDIDCRSKHVFSIMNSLMPHPYKYFKGKFPVNVVSPSQDYLEGGFKILTLNWDLHKTWDRRKWTPLLAGRPSVQEQKMENTLEKEPFPEPGLGMETSPLPHHTQLGLQPIRIHIYYSEYFTRLPYYTLSEIFDWTL